MYEEYIGPIADISHYRHYQRYHTFFKPGYILAQSATSWPILAHLGHFVANLGTFYFYFLQA